MDTIYKSFISNTTRFRARAENVMTKLHEHPYETTYISSQLISEVWMSWCRFCCNVIYASCNGSISREGKPIAARAFDNTHGRLAYEFKISSKGGTPKSGGTISLYYQEPTWGDIQSILKAIPIINPSNLSTLQSGFGIPLLGPQHLQKTRNTIAHLIPDALPSFRSILVHYSGSKIIHPSEIIKLTDPAKKTQVLFSWIEDLEIIATQVTK